MGDLVHVTRQVKLPLGSRRVDESQPVVNEIDSIPPPKLDSNTQQLTWKLEQLTPSSKTTLAASLSLLYEEGADVPQRPESSLSAPVKAHFTCLGNTLSDVHILPELSTDTIY